MDSIKKGLQLDKTLPTGTDKHEHWIWNEGKPADIVPLEGTRIILPGPPSYPRSWNASRYFSGMKGELEVLAILSQVQVDAWLTKIAQIVTP